jgi:hypothetical protein
MNAPLVSSKPSLKCLMVFCSVVHLVAAEFHQESSRTSKKPEVDAAARDVPQATLAAAENAVAVPGNSVGLALSSPR